MTLGEFIQVTGTQILRPRAGKVLWRLGRFRVVNEGQILALLLQQLAGIYSQSVKCVHMLLLNTAFAI